MAARAHMKQHIDGRWGKQSWVKQRLVSNNIVDNVLNAGLLQQTFHQKLNSRDSMTFQWKEYLFPKHTTFLLDWLSSILNLRAVPSHLMMIFFAGKSIKAYNIWVGLTLSISWFYDDNSHSPQMVPMQLNAPMAVILLCFSSKVCAHTAESYLGWTVLNLPLNVQFEQAILPYDRSRNLAGFSKAKTLSEPKLSQHKNSRRKVEKEKFHCQTLKFM